MKIERIQYKNYRSIEESSIEACGNLNILVGKNNAGKSNLLKAVKSFFQYLDADNLVSVMSTRAAEQEIYTTGESREASATITITFLLDEKAATN